MSMYVLIIHTNVIVDPLPTFTLWDVLKILIECLYYYSIL